MYCVFFCFFIWKTDTLSNFLTGNVDSMNGKVLARSVVCIINNSNMYSKLEVAGSIWQEENYARSLTYVLPNKAISNAWLFLILFPFPLWISWQLMMTSSCTINLHIMNLGNWWILFKFVFCYKSRQKLNFGTFYNVSLIYQIFEFSRQNGQNSTCIISC